MDSSQVKRAERRARQRSATRSDILSAACRVAERDGARNLSLRSVAAESGFAPAALYVYFRSKGELLLALAADDLAALARFVREIRLGDGGDHAREATSGVVDLLTKSEALAAACSALGSVPPGSASERLFNGRLIVLLSELSAVASGSIQSRESQADILLLAATLTGLATLARTGRLKALGFETEELLHRLTLPRGKVSAT